MSEHLDILTSIAGIKITNTADWERFRRRELMILLEDFVYGARPYETPDHESFTVKRCVSNYLGTPADLKEIEISVNDISFPVYIFLPHKRSRSVPAFVFVYNEYYMKQSDFNEQIDYDFMPISEIVERGYAVAVMPVYYVSPDWPHHSEFKKGVFKAIQPNAAHRTHRSWATISGWAYGASRIMDYFETDTDIDHRNIAVIGHSRAGKTALWAGATDKRFKLVISNSSGCTGAAYTRGKKGEHIKNINVSDWFCENYHNYNDREEMLPVDQHMLLACIAPRPLYVKSDIEDEWSDPEAERKSAILASPAYELYGLKGLVIEDDEVILGKKYHEGTIGYHLAPGDHNLTRFDWNCYMDFADKYLK